LEKDGRSFTLVFLDFSVYIGCLLSKRTVLFHYFSVPGFCESGGGKGISGERFHAAIVDVDT
jgi:hypothetical protein